MTDIKSDKILIIDFGSQYTQLIASCIRKIGVYCKLFSSAIDANFIKDFNPNGIILSGGPDTAIGTNFTKAPEFIFSLNIPILGICYGMHVMALQLGGKVKAATKHEYGFAKVRAHNHSLLLKDIVDSTNDKGHSLLNVWMSHGIEVNKLPQGFCRIASTDNCAIAGFANIDKNYYGLQFHPEVTHTLQGKNILTRFVTQICNCKAKWVANNIVSDTIKSLKDKIANEKVILGLSGGVDSLVTAVLLKKAIGKQLICVFVDNGLLRLNEGDKVIKAFGNMGLRIIRVNAQQEFYHNLANTAEPEAKRKLIGDTFIKIFEREARKLGDIKYLAQGTIYSDVIESAGTQSGKTKVIKSHHNVGGLPANLKFTLIEPLKELFKDEVRVIGSELGIDKHLLYRHPFPGPGLGIRIIGRVKEKYADILRLADDIFIQELLKHNLYDKVSQAFAVFLPIKSVGVTGDNREYNYVIVLRAVKTTDFMTANWARLSYDFLDIVSNRIVNEIDKVSRVVYDISGKPPATIEWE